ncbi:MAG: HEPN domain-containing protein [Candidatus Tectomicrobia bacterium]|nr:HEPN domain-containing protein [Candidatus Tectomicrobia bacterium]
MKEETQKLLDKASRAIHAAETLLQEGDVDFAAGRAYYAMFYTAKGLLNEKGLRFRRRSSDYRDSY